MGQGAAIPAEIACRFIYRSWRGSDLRITWTQGGNPLPLTPSFDFCEEYLRPTPERYYLRALRLSILIIFGVRPHGPISQTAKGREDMAEMGIKVLYFQIRWSCLYPRLYQKAHSPSIGRGWMKVKRASKGYDPLSISPLKRGRGQKAFSLDGTRLDEGVTACEKRTFFIAARANTRSCQRLNSPIECYEAADRLCLGLGCFRTSRLTRLSGIWPVSTDATSPAARSSSSKTASCEKKAT